MPGRLIVTAIAVALLALVVLAGGELLGERTPRMVTAAELWQQANVALADEAAGAPFVYDKLELTWQSSGNAYEKVLGELWQSADGTQWRYQMSDTEGNILYFLQQNDGAIWQSIHPQPVGSTAVTELFVQPAGEPVALPEGALLHRELTAGWLDLNRLLAERTAACVDLYCLLGIDAAAGSLSGVEETTWEDGRAVYEIAVALPAEFSRTLVLDQESGRLLAVEDRDRGQPVARLEHLERRGLTADELGEGFFAGAPDGLALVQASPQAGADRVWIVSVSPEPGSTLATATQFEVVVGYELVSVPEARLEVALAQPDFQPVAGGRLPIIRLGQTEVDAASSEARFTFTLRPNEEQWLGTSELALWVTLSHFTGAHTLEIIAGELFTDYSWTVAP